MTVLHTGLLALSLGSLLISSVSAASSSGCGKGLPKGQSPGNYTTVGDFKTSDGVTRSYIVNIPSKYDVNTPAPLLFSFHGHHKSAETQLKLSQFNNETWNPNAISVYPQGLKGTDGHYGWQGDPDEKEVNDVGFVLDMISAFEDAYCLDTNRIFAAGKSNGGGFTGLLACNETASQKIAAFAPVSGAFYQPLEDGICHNATVPIACNPGRTPIPILEFHGTADGTIPYVGGERRTECLPTIPHWVREWSKRNGYGLSNKTTSTFDGNVLKYEYGAAAGVQGIVTHYAIKGLNHSWPSVGPNVDNPVGTYIDATPLIIQFFDDWPLDRKI